MKITNRDVEVMVRFLLEVSETREPSQEESFKMASSITHALMAVLEINVVRQLGVVARHQNFDSTHDMRKQIEYLLEAVRAMQNENCVPDVTAEHVFIDLGTPVTH